MNWEDFVESLESLVNKYEEENGAIIGVLLKEHLKSGYLEWNGERFVPLHQDWTMEKVKKLKTGKDDLWTHFFGS
jgi:hypothetical protein